METKDTAIHTTTLVVHVRYLGAKRQFVEPHAPVTQTLTALKPQVLDFFKLVESHGEGSKVYIFAKDSTPITDLSITLGKLADGKHELKLDLIEQLEQGA